MGKSLLGLLWSSQRIGMADRRSNWQLEKGADGMEGIISPRLLLVPDPLAALWLPGLRAALLQSTQLTVRGQASMKGEPHFIQLKTHSWSHKPHEAS